MDNLKLEDYVPVVRYNGGILTDYPIETTSDLVIGGNVTVSGGIDLGEDVEVDGLIVLGNSSLGDSATDTVNITGITTLTSANASAFAVGANGATNPSFQIDASAQFAENGLKITSSSATSGVRLDTISSNVNEALHINSKGLGNLLLGAFQSAGSTVNSARPFGVLYTTSTPAGGATGQGIKFGSSTNFGIFFGSGAPTLSAFKGSLYLRSDGTGTDDRFYINTDGSTGWTAGTTAA